jgi:hypothetical protein
MTAIAAIVVVVLIVAAGIATLVFLRRRRTEELRSRFGGAEYGRTVAEDGSRRDAKADQLQGDAISARGCPVSDFDQRAADISVDHPVVRDNDRTDHGVRLCQRNGRTSTDDFRQAKIHFWTLFEELVGKSKGRTQTVVS